MKVIFLDAGHGGIDPRSGKYMTAPKKMFKHDIGEFQQGTTFLEGVKNREYCSLLHKRLTEEGISVIPVYHEWRDTPLGHRVEVANKYNESIANGIYISEHSNAANKRAKGFSVWTSIGQTKSDEYSDILMKEYKETFGDDNSIRIREQDYRDGDSDYEENFYVLRKTNMPSILIENLFFDNFEDAKKLMCEDYKVKYIECLVSWIKKIV
jgi:N-acetylmuramoyl-L-alanine amidase